ncbi:MAG: hybrid sensor histidine kinase/response regulator, partial [Vulcanimicrobiaceae bacterium]
RRANPVTLREELSRITSPSALDELRLENRDLIAALSELETHQEQLVQLNGELEETNRGVMAMYAQLADELEETNRGVVALYAEIDEKTVRLNEANEAKSRFLANVSHELRSPVNSILALGRLLLDPSSDGLTGAQRQQLELVRSSGGELLLLVNQLLDLAKAESGRIEPDVTTVDLGALFAELRGALRPLARAGVTLVVDAPTPLPPVETDPMLLGQVLRNLLTNALKFTPHGTVRLAARVESAHALEITVSDTGIGIAREDLERIFEEFYQVRGPLQVEQKGTGLGLPYARRLAQTLGAEMRVESESGRGSTFTLRVPLVWQPLLRAPHTPGQQPPAPVSVGTVLIVDDDEGFRTALRGMLQGLASQVLEARGGIEGLQLLREYGPELAFVDLRMPDLDGAAVLAEMSSDPRLRAIPVVIVTSAELSPSLQTILGSAAAVLAKATVSRESVRGAIAAALERTALPT